MPIVLAGCEMKSVERDWFTVTAVGGGLLYFNADRIEEKGGKYRFYLGDMGMGFIEARHVAAISRGIWENKPK